MDAFFVVEKKQTLSFNLQNEKPIFAAGKTSLFPANKSNKKK
ncbi:Hypothetical protein I595_1334 [Croceitalea dokdonensis DOKDO 023]|uniref:Uncharacterized protein n=1 Tax=Croceitalea dokdonensis DOKDO 023 TaxID=1300341 RepID=A0A0P7B1G5_9FLAO|nr:Hypothetical protein I595_1334 [Croceitalea dokdonensis DOKDO 023]